MAGGAPTAERKRSGPKLADGRDNQVAFFASGVSDPEPCHDAREGGTCGALRPSNPRSSASIGLSSLHRFFEWDLGGTIRAAYMTGCFLLRGRGVRFLPPSPGGLRARGRRMGLGGGAGSGISPVAVGWPGTSGWGSSISSYSSTATTGSASGGGAGG